MKAGRVVLALGGRYAGRKAVVVKVMGRFGCEVCLDNVV